MKTTVQSVPTKERSFIRSSEAKSLQELTPQQWKSGIAAWLGWLFDGLDMHLYTLVAAPFVMQLLHANSLADPSVKQHSAWIQAAFLIGWALGGGFFGRVGDLAGPQPGVKPDHRHLRRVHRAFLLCSNLVASAHLPFPRGIGYRWRVGRRFFVAF